MSTVKVVWSAGGGAVLARAGWGQAKRGRTGIWHALLRLCIQKGTEAQAFQPGVKLELSAKAAGL